MQALAAPARVDPVFNVGAVILTCVPGAPPPPANVSPALNGVATTEQPAWAILFGVDPAWDDV